MTRLKADVTNECWMLTAPRELRWSVATPSADTGEMVAVEILYCGICGSDMSMYEGRRSLQYPVSIGHEFVGRIAALPESHGGSLSLGDVVTGDFNHRCGRCDHCVEGRSHLCRHGQVAPRFSHRAFTRHTWIHEECLVSLRPEDDKPWFVLCEPMSCVLHALDRASPDQADRTLALGCGSLGLSMAFAVCADTSLPRVQMWDPSASRRSAIRSGSNGRVVVSEPYEDYDLVFDLTGQPDGLRDALARVRSGGRVVSMSHLDGYGDTSFVLPMLTRRDVLFTVSYLNGHCGHFVQASSIIRRQWHTGWTEAFAIHPLSELSQALADRRSSAACKDLVQCCEDT